MRRKVKYEGMPNCHELVGDSVKICFNCHYDFSLGRVVDSSRIAEERRNEVLRIQQLKENQREEIKKGTCYT